MKKSGILLSILSLVTAASAFSASASAAYIKEGDTPAYDIAPTVEGSVVEEHIDLGNGFGRVYDYYADENGEPVTGHSLLYIEHSYPNELESRMLLRAIDSETGEIKDIYTGFTKSKKGRSYYYKGERIYGWYKVGKSWYHFNEKGYADTGRVKICDGYYTFDEKGRWAGNVSRKALAPEDFSLELSLTGMTSFDTDGNIFYGEGCNSDGEFMSFEEKINFSDRDRQAIYCMFLESGFGLEEDSVYENEYFTYFIDGYIDEHENIEVSATEPSIYYTASVNLGGESAKISFGYDCRQIIHVDEECLSAYRLTQNLKAYYYNCLREKYPKPEGIDWVGID